MTTKILEKLRANKGSNSVSSRTLEEQAQRLTALFTTDEQLEAFDFKGYVDTLGGNISKDVADQIKQAKDNSNTRTPEQIAADLESERLAKEAEVKANKEKGISPEMALMMENQKAMMEMISNMNGEKITSTRSGALNDILKDAPDYYKNQVLAGFNQMSFKEDSDFESFKELTKTNLGSFQQTAKEQGLNLSVPKSDVKKLDKEELSPIFKAAMEAHDEQQKSKE